MSKIENLYETYLCDFCKDSEMFSHEESWERLDDGRDRCVKCLIELKNQALESLKPYREDNDDINHLLLIEENDE